MPPSQPRPRPRPRTATSTDPRPFDPIYDTADDELATAGEWLRKAALGLTGALVVARAYWPGEGIRTEEDSGMGLRWTLAVLIAAVLAGVAGVVGGRVRFRWSWTDAAVYAFMALVGLSASHGAERRLAVNLAWDWIGVGVAYALLRLLPRGRNEVATLAGVLMATAVAVAAYGLYQSVVEWPATREFYLAHREEFLRAQNIEPGSPAQALFENRLLQSNEPTATFALANSLAGFLVGPAVLGLAVGLESLRRRETRMSLALILGALPWLLIVACLVLTKSRSAYLGLALATLVLAWRARRALPPRTLAMAGLAGAVVLAGMVFAGIQTGRLDRQVLSESTKSLRYRWEYWQGAWDVIRREPGAWWSGVGPGNFGDAYLRHKRAWASEEVADPHNFVLEAWAVAGIGAAVALILALGFGLRDAFGPSRGVEAQPVDEEGPRGKPLRGLVACAGGGWLLAGPLGGLDPFQPGLEARWLILGVAWGATVLLGLPIWRRVPIPAAGLGAAALAIMVNLLAAGGLGFAPVSLGLWACLALAQNLRTDRPCGHVRQSRGRAGAFGLAAVAVALVGGFVGAIGPFWEAESLLDSTQLPARMAGDSAERLRAIDQAVAGAEKANEADRLSVRPYLQLAELEYRGWQARGHLAQDQVWYRIDTAFLKAMQPPRNPHSLTVRRREAVYARAILESYGGGLPLRQRDWLRNRIADALKHAVPLSPTNAALRAEYAEALADIDQKRTAATEAREALRLDAVARQARHPDKQLPKAVRERLKAALPRWDAASVPGPVR